MLQKSIFVLLSSICLTVKGASEQDLTAGKLPKIDEFFDSYDLATEQLFQVDAPPVQTDVDSFDQEDTPVAEALVIPVARVTRSTAEQLGFACSRNLVRSCRSRSIRALQQQGFSVESLAFKCKVCSKGFTRQDSLVTHMKNIHKQSTAYIQQMCCGVLFKSPNGFALHKKSCKEKLAGKNFKCKKRNRFFKTP